MAYLHFQHESTPTHWTYTLLAGCWLGGDHWQRSYAGSGFASAAGEVNPWDHLLCQKVHEEADRLRLDTLTLMIDVPAPA